jgi:hypothetical protein
LLLAFVNEPAARRYECQNRDTSFNTQGRKAFRA